MNDPVPADPLSRSRKQVLQDTFSSAVDSMDPSIEVGITMYGGGSYPDRGVAFPISPLSDDATTLLMQNLLQNDPSISPSIPANSPNHRGMFDLSTDQFPDPSSATLIVKDYLKEIVNSWTPAGNTPIPGALYEVARYFKGDVPDIGNKSANYLIAAHPSTYTGSNYETRSSVIYTTKCATEAQCTNKDPSDPSACTLVASATTTSLYGGLTNIQACIADNSCPYCSIIPAAAPAAAAPFTSLAIDCTSNTDTSCGTSCGINKGTVSEPLYRCASTPPTVSLPSPTYSCTQYYQCNQAPSDTWALTTGATYTSPITDECDSNFLVLLSDGEPYDTTSNTSSRQTKIESYLSLAECQTIPGEDDNTNTLSYGRCAPEILQHLANTDLNTTMNGEQHVNTYTIGFGVDDPSPAKNYLSLLATQGGGRYYSANNAANLTQVFQNLLTTLTEQSALSLTSSGFSVNASTQISHNNDVFIPIMKKIDGQPTWAGNIKKFTLSNGRTVDTNSRRAIEANGTLKRNSVDLWATGSTADPVISGGAAGLLNPVSRKLYTNINGTNNTSGNKGTWGAPLNELKTSNSDITLAMLSVPTTAYRNEVLDYIRGYAIPPSGSKDCTDPTQATVTDTGNCGIRQHMGDILHSTPIVISYDNSDATKRYVFFGTNEGYLHAISANDGEEKFAFMPQDLLDNIDILYRNSSADEHPYGVDGVITVWRHDEDKDGAINAADNDHVYIYFGLRRGGRAYYALNVTDPANPKLLWKKDPSSAGYSTELGQTWSKPLLAKIKYKLSGSVIEKMAMVVGAGYDPKEDEQSRVLRNSDTSGRGVYILDAETGNIIKTIVDASIMDFSIPGDIRVLDMNKDGFMDRLYYADTGGNIFRTDLFAHKSTPYDITSDPYDLSYSDSVITRKFASLGEDTPSASSDIRKFFFEPEVSLFNHLGNATLAITIGSGYHSRPLNTVIADRFYVLFDSNIFDTPTTAPATITHANLADLSPPATANMTGKSGWSYTLPNSGEKVLSTPLIFLNKVLFTTFKPGSGGLSGSASCSTTNSHETRLYTFSLLNGAAAIDFDNDGTKEVSKRLPEGQILATPKVFFTTPSCTDSDNCDQVVEIRTSIGAPILTTSTHPGVANRGTATESIDLGSFLPKVYWLNKHQ
ncbi:MAG: PilC/PilY family type IV pilus protein [Thiotrichaceae bacterium]